MRIPYYLASLLASIAQNRAAAIGVPMAVAVTDEEGGLLFFGRMDGTLPVSTELAVSKAFTASVLRMATHELGELAQPGQMLYGIQQTHQGRIVLFGGGLPLWIHGQTAGAIGVSGGTVEQDIQVAEAAIEGFEEMQRWVNCIRGSVPSGAILEIASLQRLERLLRLELERLGRPLEDENIDVLLGAVLLHAWELNQVDRNN